MELKFSENLPLSNDICEIHHVKHRKLMTLLSASTVVELDSDHYLSSIEEIYKVAFNNYQSLKSLL